VLKNYPFTLNLAIFAGRCGYFHFSNGGGDGQGLKDELKDLNLGQKSKI